MRSAVAVVLSLSMTACSWVFMSSPPNPPPPPHVPPQCTESKAAPVVDTVIAVPHAVLALVGLLVLVESDSDGDEVGEAIGDVFGTALLIEGGLVALVYGLSARSGFRDAGRCRELKDRWRYQHWQPRAP